jgi:hypothetical protein
MQRNGGRETDVEDQQRHGHGEDAIAQGSEPSQVLA